MQDAVFSQQAFPYIGLAINFERALVRRQKRLIPFSFSTEGSESGFVHLQAFDIVNELRKIGVEIISAVIECAICCFQRSAEGAQMAPHV